MIVAVIAIVTIFQARFDEIEDEIDQKLPKTGVNNQAFIHDKLDPAAMTEVSAHMIDSPKNEHLKMEVGILQFDQINFE